MAITEIDDDKDVSLRTLALRRQSSIASQLVDIGKLCHQQRHQKFLSFISQLECLRPEDTKLYRTSIDAFREKQYVALSYTWKPSKYETDELGRYQVQNWEDHQFEDSTVRNCVLDRVIGYMRHSKIRLLWIDAHCIRQETCANASCTEHDHCVQKNNAIQVMDLVYQYSSHPIALLGRLIQDKSELHLFSRIMSSSLVHGISNYRLSKGTNIKEAVMALRLLYDITQDKWWERAWTFQENYRGGLRMRLLMRHHPSLEQHKRQYQVFGEIQGEVCVRSVDFSREATRLCLALQNLEDITPGDERRINEVLQAAGRYTIILDKSSAMTPKVVQDIEARELMKPWDRLAIIANCLQYPVRLDSAALRKQSHSLSLSVLAMCLLNGEILNNADDDAKSSARAKTSLFLKKQLFKAFDAPKDTIQRLMFYKGCRLSDVELRTDGISAMGYLWELGPVIDTAKFRRTRPWINEPKGQLSLNQRKRLQQLASYLFDLEYQELATQIDEYLAIDAQTEQDQFPLTGGYLQSMAAELAAAIRDQRKLRLARTENPMKRPIYHAVFISRDDERENGDVECPQVPRYVFTSASCHDPSSEDYDANDIDYHVSLEVTQEKPTADGTPCLRTGRWMLGMYFPDGGLQKKVVFPWPRALQLHE